MAEHPPVTMTPAQEADIVFCYPYTSTPALNVHLLAWSALLAAVAAEITVQPLSQQRTDALEALKQSNVWVQQAFAAALGIPQRPSWITVTPAPARSTP